MKIKTAYLLICIVFLALVVISCNNEENIELFTQEELQEIQNINEDNMEAEEMLSTDVENVQTEALASVNLFKSGKSAKRGEKNHIGDCAVITHVFDGTTQKGSVTIDFGTDGCTGNDGRVRKGKILIAINKRYLTTGSTHITTFDGYSVNGVTVEGERVVENITEDDGNPTHRVTVTNGKLIFTDATTIEWNSIRTREWTVGSDTPFNLLDDVFEVTGGETGTNRFEIDYQTTITNALTFKADCYLEGFFQPSDGIVTAINIAHPERIRTINFGDGECNKTFTITINGQEKEISL